MKKFKRMEGKCSCFPFESLKQICSCKPNMQNYIFPNSRYSQPSAARLATSKGKAKLPIYDMKVYDVIQYASFVCENGYIS